jgi:hypothetical protein
MKLLINDQQTLYPVLVSHVKVVNTIRKKKALPVVTVWQTEYVRCTIFCVSTRHKNISSFHAHVFNSRKKITNISVYITSNIECAIYENFSKNFIISGLFLM